jgi:hypothetical protein
MIEDFLSHNSRINYKEVISEEDNSDLFSDKNTSDLMDALDELSDK